MKNIILTAMLLGLLTGVGFAQRGRAPMGGNRGMTQANPIGGPRYMPNAIQPDARQMPPVAHGTVRLPSTTTAGTTAGRTSSTGITQSTVGIDHRSVAPPDAAVGPNVSHRSLQK